VVRSKLISFRGRERPRKGHALCLLSTGRSADPSDLAQRPLALPTMSLVIPTRLASRVPLLSPALFSRCLATEPPTSSPTPPPPASFSNPVATCRSQVERSDYDAYLASYFYPAGRHRDAFYAMRALNVSRFLSLLSFEGGGKVRRRVNHLMAGQSSLRMISCSESDNL
jgi:hypothetical protein